MFISLLKDMMKDRNQQPDKEIHRAKSGEGVWNFHALSKHTILSNLWVFTSLEALDPSPSGIFMEVSLYTQD